MTDKVIIGDAAEIEKLREALKIISCRRLKQHNSVQDYMNSVEYMAAIADIALENETIN